MERAIELATENVTSGRGGPFGAVIVRREVIVATGANLVTATNDPTAHGEIVAIRNACGALKTFRSSGLQYLYKLRALPHVPGCDLLGALRRIFYGGSAADAAAAGFDDAFLYDELKRPISGENSHCAFTAGEGN